MRHLHKIEHANIQVLLPRFLRLHPLREAWRKRHGKTFLQRLGHVKNNAAIVGRQNSLGNVKRILAPTPGVVIIQKLDQLVAFIRVGPRRRYKPGGPELHVVILDHVPLVEDNDLKLVLPHRLQRDATHVQNRTHDVAEDLQEHRQTLFVVELGHAVEVIAIEQNDLLRVGPQERPYRRQSRLHLQDTRYTKLYFQFQLIFIPTLIHKQFTFT